METKAGKTDVAKTEKRRKNEKRRKETRREGTKEGERKKKKERTKKEENDESKEDSRGVRDLGWGERSKEACTRTISLVDTCFWKESKWENADEKIIGSCNRSEERICAKEGKDISTV